jgi:hypothetical protein
MAEQRPTVAIGPEMPGWGSWEWVGADLAAELSEYYRTTTFAPGELPEADTILVVKHAPARDWVEAAARRGRVIYAPIDFYGSANEIDGDAGMLRKCGRVIVHCERLRKYFEPYAPVAYIDHHVKFAASANREYRRDGFILWVGVRTNLRSLVEWVNEHPLPAELLVLTNPEDPRLVPSPREVGFWDDSGIRIENWSKERHLEATAAARAGIDIKGRDFRSRHKPPAKAIDFLASGLPLAMNQDSCVVEHLAGLGFDVASPMDVERWLSREYWEETRRFGAALREMLSGERIGRRWRKVIWELTIDNSQLVIAN